MRPFLADLYAALSHKEALGDGVSKTPFMQTWVDIVDARRLAVYDILAAYRDNTVRYYLPASFDDVAVAKQREYGDVGQMVDQVRSLVLGEDQTIVVPDATAPDEDATAEQKAAHTRAAEFLAWWEQWAVDEHLRLKLLEEEEGSVGDGDGVFVLGWDNVRKRPRLRVYDAGWYFPDLAAADKTGTTSDNIDDEYPRTVHVAWEFEGSDNRPKLRRLTWRLVDVTDASGKPAPQRRPWSDEGADASAVTCLYEDNTYDLGRWKAGDTVYNISAAPESTRTPAPVDLRVDFIPLVHVPCDASGRRHFGRSVIMRVAQLLDDLIGADTDLQANSALVASTPTVVTGGSGANLTGGPGTQYNVPAGGSIALLDTSKTLDALLKYIESLLDRLSKNTRLAKAILGQVDPSDVPSGYSIELTFTPTHSLVREMRLVRDLKFALLLKFAARMAQAYGVLPAGPTPAARIALGPYLPADKAQAATDVTTLLAKNAMSTETAVRTLMEAGYAIDDAHAEVDRIRRENFTAAGELADATGDDTAVREYLGLPPRQTLPAPAPPGSGA